MDRRVAEGLELVEITRLDAADDDTEGAGSGRIGRLPESATVGTVAKRLKKFLSIDSFQVVGDTEKTVERIAVRRTAFYMADGVVVIDTSVDDLRASVLNPAAGA